MLAQGILGGASRRGGSPQWVDRRRGEYAMR
jgi:hypothetical protein